MGCFYFNCSYSLRNKAIYNLISIWGSLIVYHLVNKFLVSIIFHVWNSWSLQNCQMPFKYKNINKFKVWFNWQPFFKGKNAKSNNLKTNYYSKFYAFLFYCSPTLRGPNMISPSVRLRLLVQSMSFSLWPNLAHNSTTYCLYSNGLCQI